jgi:hypothetical protein
MPHLYILEIDNSMVISVKFLFTFCPLYKKIKTQINNDRIAMGNMTGATQVRVH